MPSIERIGLARPPALRRPVRPVYLPAERAGNSALVAQLGLRGDGSARLQLGLDASDRPSLILGSGSAQDLRAYRSAASTLAIDNGAGAAATLHLVGQADVAAESTPATPASGYGRLFYNSANKHFYQVDDAGNATDLTSGVTVKSASIAFTDGDTSRVVTITDAAVLATSKILGTIKRPNNSTAALVQYKQGFINSGTSLVLTLPNPTTPGNMLALHVGYNSASGFTSAALAHDTLLFKSANNTGNLRIEGRELTGIVGGDTVCTLTLAGSGGQCGATLMEVSSISSFEVANDQAWGAGNAFSNQISTLTPYEFVSAAAVWQPSGTGWSSQNAGWTALPDIVTTSGSGDIRVVTSYQFLTSLSGAGFGDQWNLSATGGAGNILAFPYSTLAAPYEYLYAWNVIDVRAGSFDVEISATAMGFEEPTVAPNETVTLAYVIG